MNDVCLCLQVCVRLSVELLYEKCYALDLWFFFLGNFFNGRKKFVRIIQTIDFLEEATKRTVTHQKLT